MRWGAMVENQKDPLPQISVKPFSSLCPNTSFILVLIFLLPFFFGQATWLVGSLFADLGLNLDPWQ